MVCELSPQMALKGVVSFMYDLQKFPGAVDSFQKSKKHPLFWH